MLTRPNAIFLPVISVDLTKLLSPSYKWFKNWFLISDRCHGIHDILISLLYFFVPFMYRIWDVKSHFLDYFVSVALDHALLMDHLQHCPILPIATITNCSVSDSDTDLLSELVKVFSVSIIW